MYTMAWFDGVTEYSACASTQDSVHCIFWCLKRYYESTSCAACWISVWLNGIPVDPEHGFRPSNTARITFRAL